MTAQARRLLVVSGNLSLLHGHYRDVIADLAAAGVDVRIRYIKETQLDPAEFQSVFQAMGVTIDVAQLPRQVREPPAELGLRLRELGNILRFLHPDYAGRTVLSDRSLEKVAPGARRWGRRLRRLPPSAAALVARAVAAYERLLPPARMAEELLELEQPDVLAVSPVIRVPGVVDYLKAAADRGIATAVWVQSWDNLTNKGLLHFVPDRVFVWNDDQRDELERYHGVPADRVSTTGAQTFDHWFTDAAVPDRAAFCAEVGADRDRPIILYLASSKQIAPDEPSFFARWLERVRASEDETLANATVLVRPHPTLAQAWHAREFDALPNVFLSPSTLDTKINSDAFRDRYRAELRHATVAVGINTSGFIDAAIFGKPACTVELPELFHGQRGTIHFQHLAREDRGLLRVDPTFEDHLQTLGALARRETYDLDEQSMAFVRAFVRPRGLDIAPRQIFVEELQELAERGPMSEPDSSARAQLGRLLVRLTWPLVGAAFEEHPVRSLEKTGRTAARRSRRVSRRLLRLASRVR